MQDMLPGLLGYCQTCAESNDSSAINDILHALCSLLLHQRPPSKTEVDLSEMECYLLDFSSLVKRSEFVKIIHHVELLLLLGLINIVDDLFN